MADEYQLEFPFMEKEKVENAYSEKEDVVKSDEELAGIRGALWHNYHSFSASAIREGSYNRRRY